MKAKIFTDGGCWPNPNGFGGWACIIRSSTGEPDVKLFGGELHTTNNRMEIRAVIEGISNLKEGVHVDIVSDSQYVVKSINTWIYRWVKKKWPQRIKNKDLWLRVWKLMDGRDVKAEWVRGHSGHPENEECDCLASNGGRIAKRRNESFSGAIGTD